MQKSSLTTGNSVLEYKTKSVANCIVGTALGKWIRFTKKNQALNSWNKGREQRKGSRGR